MTKSPPRPVPVGRYRYTKWRWRVLAHALDALGGVAMRLWSGGRPIGPWNPPRRVLVVQLDHMGDSVLSSPILPRLRAAWPGASIDVLASPSNRAVFEANPHVDRVHLADRNWFERRPGRWALGSAVWGLGLRLRREHYDLGIDVRGDVLTVLVLTLAGIPRRVGWAMGGGGFLLTDLAEWVPGRHEVASRLALLEPLGLSTSGPTRVDVHVNDADRARVASLLLGEWPRRSARRPRRVPVVSHANLFEETGSVSSRAGRDRDRRPLDEAEHLHAGRFGAMAPLLAVHLGAGTAAKRWPKPHWDDLLGRFLQDGWRVVIVGGPDDADRAEGISSHENLRDWTGRLAVTETTALLERADLFIGADSGPAHLAACAGVPSVILFSGTNRARQWRPWSRRSLVLKHRVACRPCHHKTCPLANHPCMTGLDPDRVYQAARRWWARLHRAESPHAPI
ncbi:N/A [soil metagenome]